MKLYFYVFESNRFEFTECEVEEKAKSYTLLEKVPGVYLSRILKSEMGLRTEYTWKQIVVLDKRDDKLAKKYISDYINKEIAKRQEEIEGFEKKLKIVNEWSKDNE